MAGFRSLDLNLLRVFDDVMAERNLTRAAHNLAMTQPAVSNALRRLREALGDPLLVRVGNAMEPTARALELWPAVRQALEGLQGVIASVDFDLARARDAFVLALADATAALLVPPLVRRLEADAPGITLRLRPLTTRDPRALLAAAEADAAVGYFPGAIAAITQQTMQQGVAEAFEHERLYSGEYVCVMRRDHPLAARPLTLDDYCAARHLLVSFSGRPFGFVDEALAALKRSRRIVLTVNQFFTAGQVVARTDLLTVLPAHFLASTGQQRAFAIQPLPLEVPRVHVDLLWHRRHDARPAHLWLRRAIGAVARAAFPTPGAAPGNALTPAATVSEAPGSPTPAPPRRGKAPARRAG
jgi:DNA-binding transcriptional LysR family regulator